MTDLRKALEPFALISSEGVVTEAAGYVTVTTRAEYFHRARAALSTAGWRPIETATEAIAECWLWCVEEGKAVQGRVSIHDTRAYAYGNGMHGDWTFTHFMPLVRPAPPAPEANHDHP